MDTRTAESRAAALPRRPADAHRQDDDRLYVHSEASNPSRWRYVQSSRGRRAQHDRDASADHVLRPHPPAGALFDVGYRQDDELSSRRRTSRCNCCGAAVARGRSVRSASRATAIPAACFVTFDTEPREITYCRVPYDVEAAAQRIRDNGLPRWLADRLSTGR